jgi:uncharacterized repeat protein (TIGR02543 family)
MEITCTAGEGYTFDRWSGDCTGSGPCAVTMDRARAVEAVLTAVAGP